MGSICPTYNGGLISMNLHDFIILMTLPIRGINIFVGVQWNTISEYIPKLQIHQQMVEFSSWLTYVELLYSSMVILLYGVLLRVHIHI